MIPNTINIQLVLGRFDKHLKTVSSSCDKHHYDEALDILNIMLAEVRALQASVAILHENEIKGKH
jgi:hypothetical protein